MFDRVIVPLDGSESAEAAIDVAAGIARKGGAEVVLTAVEPVKNEKVELRLEELAQELDVPSRTILFEGGAPADRIVQLAQAEAPAIICMATHGRRPVGAMVLGSVSGELVRRRAAPVVAVGPHYHAASASFATLVVPLDGSDFAETALEFVKDFAGALGLLVKVVSVVDAHAVETAVSMGTPLSDVREESYVSGIAHDLATSGLEVDWEVLHDHDPARAIATYVADLEAPLVAMTTHGRSAVRAVVLGSVATKLLHRATFPVVLLRPDLPEA